MVRKLELLNWRWFITVLEATSARAATSRRRAGEAQAWAAAQATSRAGEAPALVHGSLVGAA